MSKELQKMLLELKNRGNTALGHEVEAFLEANTKQKNLATFPYSRKLLAQAAKELREGGDVNLAHDYLGASVEVYKEESKGEAPSLPASVTASLGEEMASEQSFKNALKINLGEESPEFNEAPQEVAESLANLLRDGGYIEEARKYLTEYNSREEGEQTVATTNKSVLKKLVAQYREGGDLVRAKALEEVLSDLEEGEELPPKDSEGMQDDFLADESKGEEGEGEGEDKPVLPVEPASEEECKEKEAAQAALASGNIKKAKAHLAKATRMERMRLTAALIKIGDIEMAMAGLDEAEKDELPADEKAGGYNKPAGAEGEGENKPYKDETDEGGESHVADEKPTDEECAKREAEAKEKADAEEEEVKVAEAMVTKIRKAIKAGRMTTAKATLKDLTTLEKDIVAGVETAEKKLKDMALAKEGYSIWAAVRKMSLNATKLIAEVEGDEKEVEKAQDGLEALKEETPFTDPKGEKEDLPPETKPEEKPADEKEVDEKEVAEAIARHVRKAVKAGNMVKAKAGLKDLAKLEKEIVAGVKVAEKAKDETLAKEGFELWREVRAMNLKAIKLVAEEEGDTEKVEQAEEGLDALDKGSDDLSESLDSEPASEEETPEVAPEEKDEQEGEAEAMKYEVLQNVEELKNMKVDRSALAFTFWESQEDPHWTIQASGKPIASVHLNDQNDPTDVAAFFCDQARWPNVIAQTAEKVGLYDMLNGVKARFYAHAVTKSTLAASLKKEVEASLNTTRTERLATLRTDFTDAMVVAADALNKGLIAGKTNPLKKSFVDKLASLGFSNPALVVEECFASAFRPYLDQVVADAQEYLEMPKEAFAHTKKMVSAASNIAVAQASQFSDETLSERLARRSMPLAPSAEAMEAPAEIEAAFRQMSAAEKSNDMKRRLRLGSKSV